MLTKNEALTFLYQAKEWGGGAEYNAGNDFSSGYSLVKWMPWRHNKYQSGIEYSQIFPFNFGEQFDFKSIDDLIAEIEASEVFDSKSHEAKIINRLMSRKEGYFVELLHSDLEKIEQHFLDYLQDATGLDRLYTIDVGGKHYRISPYSLFYIHPFFNGNDNTSVAERKNIIEQKLNQELEKRVSLDVFLKPFCENKQRKELAGLIMLARDGYVIPNAQNATQNTQRFFAMTKKLPQELYGLVTKSFVNSQKEILTDSAIVEGAKDMLLKF